MRLTLTEFLSLDGVSQGPGSPDEDTTDGFTRGGWFVPHLDETFMQHVVSWIDGADGFLFGRRTYEGFAQAWPLVTDPDDPVATKLNGLPKYVASQSLAAAEWGPATILSGDVPSHVAQLKRQPGRELQTHGVIAIQFHHLGGIRRTCRDDSRPYRRRSVRRGARCVGALGATVAT
jgi:dihydrofolate reductase